MAHLDPSPGGIRRFDSGATRDTNLGKLDYDGFLSPLVIRRYAEYMHAHRLQSDGMLRDSDNWQKGIPQDEYRKSAWRHWMDWWSWCRGRPIEGDVEDVACALLFNVMGWLHERLKQERTL